jgi:hypothetical protein
MMKNKAVIQIFLAVTGSICLWSCKKYLDVENPSTLSQTTVFNSVSYANSAVIGVYNQLIGDNGYGNRISCLYPQSADDFKTSGDYNPNDRRGIGKYGAAPTNTELDKPFRQLYTGIERANICIKYIPASGIYQNGTDAEKAQMRDLYGEALTLRAQFYYELVRNWGDVPAQWIPSADMTDLYQPQTNRDTIYAHLLDDLKIAEDLVPWRSDATTQVPTRITKGVVKGLRARIALACGGYALRGSTIERRSDYQQFYKIAYDECSDIISRRDEHDLNPVYENIFRALNTGNYEQLDPTHELMWVVGAYGGNSHTDSKLGYYNGLKIDKASRFGGGGGGINVIPTYFYEFDSIGDGRRDVTIDCYEINKNSQKILTGAAGMTDGKFRRSWTGITGTSQNLAIDWPLLRFADVLLMYAEADNEINGAPSQAAQDALEQVRARAFKGHEDRMEPIPTDKEGFFNAIVHERLLEFGGEGIRKYDLIRWNLLADKIAETRQKLTDFMNGTGRYVNVPQFVYALPGDYDPSVASTQVVAGLDLFGGAPSRVLFYPDPQTGPSPDAGYQKISWRDAVNADYISSDRKGYAQYFEADRSELFPFYYGVLNQNYKLKQNNGY